MNYLNLTDTGMARKLTLWQRKYREAEGRAASNHNESSRAWWAMKRQEAAAELEKIRAALQIRRLCS